MREAAPFLPKNEMAWSMLYQLLVLDSDHGSAMSVPTTLDANPVLCLRTNRSQRALKVIVSWILQSVQLIYL